MPTLDDNQLVSQIASREVNAITLDTSIFDKFNCNLDYRMLRSLDQFKGTQVTLIFSEVVAGEVIEHIRKEAEKQAAELRAAINQYRRRWKRQESVEELAAPIDLKDDASAFARRQWVAFLESNDGIVVSAEGNVRIADLLQRYFDYSPPFSRSEKKKNEFPDAICLLSLEAWAAATSKKLLIISKDGDWKGFAAQSTRLFYYDDLGKVLDVFHRAERFIAERIVALLRADRFAALSDAIHTAIQAYLDDLDFDIEGETGFDYEAEPLSAILQFFTSETPPLMVSSSEKEITSSLDVECAINFEAEFQLYVHDGVDKE